MSLLKPENIIEKITAGTGHCSTVVDWQDVPSKAGRWSHKPAELRQGVPGRQLDVSVEILMKKMVLGKTGVLWPPQGQLYKN